MTTPADELRQAADKLQRACAAAAPGPWTVAKVPPYTDPLLLSRYEETPDDEDVLIVGTVDLEPEGRAVVQLLHPGVGTALADWLKESAVVHLPDTECGYCDPRRNPKRLPCPALTVARQINAAST